MNYKLEEFYSVSVQESLSKLDSSEDGLKQSVIEERLKKFGLNEFSEGKKKSIFLLSPWFLFSLSLLLFLSQ